MIVHFGFDALQNISSIYSTVITYLCYQSHLPCHLLYKYAVKNLTDVMPLLLTKLHTVEHKFPSDNISSSILRIRELIAQTRSVASKVCGHFKIVL